jgi:hypothetical protein
MDELIRDSNDDTLEDDDPVPVLAIPPSCTASQRRIALASLFSYAERAGADCLEFYWKGGLRNIEWLGLRQYARRADTSNLQVRSKAVSKGMATHRSRPKLSVKLSHQCCLGWFIYPGQGNVRSTTALSVQQ